VADAVIAGIILLAIYWGLRRGLIGPLVGEACFVIAFVIVTRFHSQLASFLPSAIPQFATTAVLLIAITFICGLLTRPLVALIRRLPLVGSADRTAGMVAHGLLAFILVYLVVGAILDFDRQIYPVLISARATAEQVQTYRDAVNSNPVVRLLVNQKGIDAAQQQAGGEPLPLSKFQQIEGFLDFYIKHVREPMSVSRLAPIVNNVGANLPFIGHSRPYMQGVSQ
jgi:uncharacterized membrane protein required for colicin V production